MGCEGGGRVGGFAFVDVGDESPDEFSGVDLVEFAALNNGEEPFFITKPARKRRLLSAPSISRRAFHTSSGRIRRTSLIFGGACRQRKLALNESHQVVVLAFTSRSGYTGHRAAIQTLGHGTVITYAESRGTAVPE